VSLEWRDLPRETSGHMTRRRGKAQCVYSLHFLLASNDGVPLRNMVVTRVEHRYPSSPMRHSRKGNVVYMAISRNLKLGGVWTNVGGGGCKPAGSANIHKKN